MVYQDQYTDPLLTFDKGVAAIDVLTLNAAAAACEEQLLKGGSFVLPAIAKGVSTQVFNELLQVVVEGMGVTAAIDTKKMTWHESVTPQKSLFVDYNGVERKSVRFHGLQVAVVSGVQTTYAPLILENGRTAWMWFAEVSLDALRTMGYYQLFAMAQQISAQFESNAPEQYDQIQIPAQQIDYQRTMNDIIDMNQANKIEVVKQKAKVAIDDTGARVVAETHIRLSAAPQMAPQKTTVFGSRNPVVFWLTEPEASAPFAVVATESDAWLSPQHEVSFDFSESLTDV